MQGSSLLKVLMATEGVCGSTMRMAENDSLSHQEPPKLSALFSGSLSLASVLAGSGSPGAVHHTLSSFSILLHLAPLDFGPAGDLH